MLVIEWKNSAISDLTKIVDYIAQENPTNAERMKYTISKAAKQLTEMPYINRRGRVAGTREKVVHPNYIIVYQITMDKIKIVNIVHSRRNYPN